MKLLTAIMFALFAATAFAVEPDEILADPVLEERARIISKELRCVVCQNQDIDSSNAGVARDLRVLVRERLVAGDSNDDVIKFVHARYGDYVLMRPPLNPSTFALWSAPFVLVFFALLVGFSVIVSSQRKRAANDLTEAEEAEVMLFIEKNGPGEKQ